MFLSIILLIVGFVLLIKGADIFVDGASSTAENFKVSKLLIGLTIVAFGTSAPELAVSINALASGNTDMVLGNVVGSCVLNILLILGIAALIRPIKIKETTVKKELPLCVLISALLAVVFLDTLFGNGDVDQITRSDAIVILLFFTVFLYYLISLARRGAKSSSRTKSATSARTASSVTTSHRPRAKSAQVATTSVSGDSTVAASVASSIASEPTPAVLGDATPLATSPAPKYNLPISFLLVGLGLAGVIFGSNLVVDSASSIAATLGLSERLISLTVIAFGTSLPELVTTIVAARKGEQDLLVGNIIGSNIFNICIVLGVPVAIFGTLTPAGFQLLDIIMLVVSAIILFIFSFSTKHINRIEGAIMLALFCAYYTFVLMT